MTSELRSASHHPAEPVLDDVELLGADLLPESLANALVRRVAASLPPDVRGGDLVDLVDEEGVPVAAVAPDGSSFRWIRRRSPRPFDGRSVLGPARDALGGRAVAVVDTTLTRDDIETIRAAAMRAPITVLVVAASNGPVAADGLIRAAIVAVADFTDVVVLRRGAPQGDLDREALEATMSALGATSRLELHHTGEVPPDVSQALSLPTDSGLPGSVILLTGLSGSGKSTLARALRDRIVENGLRQISLLDGDVVRRNLSAGLGFGREDRERNIRRIGWVAAEIARHDGLAVCSPIAPFAETRSDVRAMAEGAGAQFVLIHVATSLAECERRDRKGLYAKARAGVIPDFTGISSPYEVPTDADLRVDTEGRDLEQCLAEIVQVLRSRAILPTT